MFTSNASYRSKCCATVNILIKIKAKVILLNEWKIAPKIDGFKHLFEFFV